ncbi:hypothetical protein BJ546DRAFT_86140 [Cryomyces antarcticus]
MDWRNQKAFGVAIVFITLVFPCASPRYATAPVHLAIVTLASSVLLTYHVLGDVFPLRGVASFRSFRPDIVGMTIYQQMASSD